MQLRIFSAPPPILRPHRSPEVVPSAVTPRRRPAHPPGPAMTMTTTPTPMPTSTDVTQLAPAPVAPPIAPLVDAAASATPGSAKVPTLATAQVPTPPVASPTDTAITTILASASPYGESVATIYARKERELAALFAALSVPEAQQLHVRLSTPAAGDVVAAQFERLVADRRVRLLSVLASASRRAMTKTDRRAA